MAAMTGQQRTVFDLFRKAQAEAEVARLEWIAKSRAREDAHYACEQAGLTDMEIATAAGMTRQILSRLRTRRMTRTIRHEVLTKVGRR
jgi:hypothetical protein